VQQGKAPRGKFSVTNTLLKGVFETELQRPLGSKPELGGGEIPGGGPQTVTGGVHVLRAGGNRAPLGLPFRLEQ